MVLHSIRNIVTNCIIDNYKDCTILKFDLSQNILRDVLLFFLNLYGKLFIQDY